VHRLLHARRHRRRRGVLPAAEEAGPSREFWRPRAKSNIRS
jgi:hypothetical protein